MDKTYTGHRDGVVDISISSVYPNCFGTASIGKIDFFFFHLFNRFLSI